MVVATRNQQKFKSFLVAGRDIMPDVRPHRAPAKPALTFADDLRPDGYDLSGVTRDDDLVTARFTRDDGQAVTLTMNAASAAAGHVTRDDIKAMSHFKTMTQGGRAISQQTEVQYDAGQPVAAFIYRQKPEEPRERYLTDITVADAKMRDLFKPAPDIKPGGPASP